MRSLGEKAKEAFGLTALVFLLGCLGLLLRGELHFYLNPSGLFGLACAFAVFYVFIFAWTFWFYRR